MTEEVICTAHVATAEVPVVQLVGMVESPGSIPSTEVFRLGFADGMTIDVPAQVLGAMLIVGRCSWTLPAELFGGTENLVQSIDRLVKAIEAERADRPAPLLAAA